MPWGHRGRRRGTSTVERERAFSFLSFSASQEFGVRPKKAEVYQDRYLAHPGGRKFALRKSKLRFLRFTLNNNGEKGCLGSERRVESVTNIGRQSNIQGQFQGLTNRRQYRKCYGQYFSEQPQENSCGTSACPPLRHNCCKSVPRPYYSYLAHVYLWGSSLGREGETPLPSCAKGNKQDYSACTLCR